MPNVLPKARPDDLLRPFQTTTVVVSLLASMVVVGLGWWQFHRIRLAATAPVVSSAANTPIPHCAAAGQSFCATAAIFARYVAQADFSDVLESQTPSQITCSSGNTGVNACAGIANSAAVRAYAVQQGDAITYYSRNGYINFLRAYASQAGAFSAPNLAVNGPIVTMTFSAVHNNKTLALKFQVVAGAWHVLYPVAQ